MSIWWYGERLRGFQQKTGPTGIREEKGVLWQCDDTHQNSVEICPIKKYSYSAERSKRKEEWSEMKDLSNVNFDFVPEGEMYESF